MEATDGTGLSRIKNLETGLCVKLVALIGGTTKGVDCDRENPDTWNHDPTRERISHTADGNGCRKLSNYGQGPRVYTVGCLITDTKQHWLVAPPG